MLPVFITIENDEERSLAERLYLTYKNKMYGIAYAVLRNRADAEDAVMDSVYKIVNNISRFSDADRNKTESLIAIIIRNTAINKYNYNKRRRMAPSDDQCDRLPDSDPTPDELFIQSEDYDRLLRTIRRLAPIYRDVILLKYLYEYDNVVIASLTGISETTVRVRLMRAKTLLESLLKEGVPDENR